MASGAQISGHIVAEDIPNTVAGGDEEVITRGQRLVQAGEGAQANLVNSRFIVNNYRYM